MRPDDELEDDEEWGGIAATQSQTTAFEENTATGTKPKLPPTGEELRVINDAKDLFRSSTFKLQVYSGHKLSLMALTLFRLMLSYQMSGPRPLKFLP